MYKIVMPVVLAAAAVVSGCPSSAFAMADISKFVGNWKQVPKDSPNESYQWTIDGNGRVYLGATVAGTVMSVNGSEITFSFTSGYYKGTVTFDRLTNYGSMTFTDAPWNSPKKKNPGPYPMKMTRG